MSGPANSFKIFGIGLSKTGTSSLSQALNQLEFPTIHYPCDQTTFDELTSGKYRLSVLQQYQGVTDISVAPFFAQFDELYPGSKFILTVRDQEAWLKSSEAHWSFMRQWCARDRIFKQFNEFITACVYGTLEFNVDRFRYVYDLHIRNVFEYFRDRKDDLLVMDICAGDGWEMLCDFLGKTVPSGPFPHANKKEEKLEGEKWMRSLDTAVEELHEIVPAGAKFILVDGNQFAGSELCDADRTLPFIGRNGTYWALPPTSQTAITELERLRGKGASYFVIGWPCFWWLDHYADLAEYLKKNYPCVLDNEQLVVFDLQTST